MHDSSQGKKCEGFKQYVIKEMNYDEFQRCLLEGEHIYKDQPSFRSISHRISSINQRKLALSRKDDTRVLCPDYVSTLAKGHQ